MKEVRYFYAPAALTTNELPSEEAAHASKVLRLQPGDEVVLIDGKGSFHQMLVDKDRDLCNDT